jgi:hypothetical protein
MKIDEVLHETFQAEIENHIFREPKAEEISWALKRRANIPKKKSWFPMTIAAAILSCFILAIFLLDSYNNMSIQPLAKTITMKLPENPEESLLAFWSLIQLNEYSGK